MPTLHPDEFRKVGGVCVQYEDNEEDVLNLTTWVMKITQGKLIQQDDWCEWEQSE